MKFAIIVSEKDKAAMNIKSALTGTYFKPTKEFFEDQVIFEYGETKLYTIKSDSVSFETSDKIDADFIIFATKHQSKAGTPSLSAHVVGNWGSAELGGKPKTLGIADSQFVKRALQLLEEKNLSGFESVQEATHHGPNSTKPLLFIEIGSSDKEYANSEAGRIIAETIIELLTFKPKDGISAVGIGGLHHTPNFKKIQINTDIAVGHICPKYALDSLNKEMLLQAIEKTIPKPQLIILDWKGLGEHKERIRQLAEEVSKELNLKVMKTHDF